MEAILTVKKASLELKEKEAKKRAKEIGKEYKRVKKYLKFLTKSTCYDGAIPASNGLFIAYKGGIYDVFNFEKHLRRFASFADAYNYINKLNEEN